MPKFTVPLECVKVPLECVKFPVMVMVPDGAVKVPFVWLKAPGIVRLAGEVNFPAAIEKSFPRVKV